MKFHSKIGIAIALYCTVASCKKENNAPVVPQIHHVSMDQSETELLWKIGFVDGDGDIGMEKSIENTNQESLHLVLFGKKDTNSFEKVDNIRGYLIDVIENVNPNRPLKGQIELTIDYLDLLKARYDTIYYEANLEDRAGHISNTLESPVLVIN